MDGLLVLMATTVYSAVQSLEVPMEGTAGEGRSGDEVETAG